MRFWGNNRNNKWRLSLGQVQTEIIICIYCMVSMSATKIKVNDSLKSD